ncbi:hypothetical protein DSO57_1008035 [Entomophthora muscae]|uniref:Uncharacterized protein n=1 Tax=Entomophthora muscae TaxID=34485 RepID=A0ACC2UT45_9FUNG|nr:hypothetical protein DSO57_1008035 [Entomophthora muscae]
MVPTLFRAIHEVLKQFKVFEKFSKSNTPLNSVLPGHTQLPFEFQGIPLALDRATKKVGHVQAQPLRNLEKLAHTLNEQFVLSFTAKTSSPSLVSPPTT